MNSEVFKKINETVPFLDKGIIGSVVLPRELSRMGLDIEKRFIEISDEAELRLRDGSSLDYVYVVGRYDINLFWSNYALRVREANYHEVFQEGRLLDGSYGVARETVKTLAMAEGLETTLLNQICAYESKR